MVVTTTWARTSYQSDSCIELHSGVARALFFCAAFPAQAVGIRGPLLNGPHLKHSLRPRLAATPQRKECL
jgi:hypothetical protein